MKKILWIGKNNPLPSQMAELKKLFGEDTAVTVDTKAFSSANDIFSRYRRGGFDEIILLAPLSVSRKVLNFGLKPLYPEMEGCPSDEAEITVTGSLDRASGTARYYRFSHFKRMESIQMKFSRIKPTS